MALPDIQELVERTIFHAIRTRVVAEGYLPDINSYDVTNSDINIAKAAQANYRAAVKAIADGPKGFAIEVFNYGPSQHKGTMKVPRIVVDTQAFLPGEVGHDPSLVYEPNGGNFDGNRFVSLTSNFYYHLRLLGNTTKQIRVLHGIMVSVLPRRGYIMWDGDTELRPSGNLLNRYISNVDYSWKDEGIVEKVYRYEIPDVHELDPQTLATVVPIIQIDTLDMTIT